MHNLKTGGAKGLITKIWIIWFYKFETKIPKLYSIAKVEVFHDPLDKDGTNCTGIFVVRITPNEDDKRLYLNVYGLMICMQVKE